MTYILHTMLRLDGRVGHYVTINGVDFLALSDGVVKIYPCGTKVFISNNWFE